MIGAFCEVYGMTIENQVLEYLLENQELDIAIGDMAEELHISRPKAYQVIKEFQEKEYVKKSRIIGNTQLYRLNKHNKRVQLFLSDFKKCLHFIAEESQTNAAEIVHIARLSTAPAKRVSS